MPRGFSDDEKAAIRARLLDVGRSRLVGVGLRKTSVEDLTSAVGISKGAFYLFFPSKEELFFAVFEAWEAEYQAKLLTIVASSRGAPADRLRSFFEQAITQWKTSPLFQHFGRDDYALLLRGLPPERVAAHLRSDEKFVERLLAAWRDAGIRVLFGPEQWTSLMRALFFVSLHADDIGTAYPWTINMLTGLLADHLSAAGTPPRGKRP